MALNKWRAVLSDFAWLTQFCDDPRALLDVVISRLDEGTMAMQPTDHRKFSLVCPSEATLFDCVPRGQALGHVLIDLDLAHHAYYVVMEVSEFDPDSLPLIFIYKPPQGQFTLDQLWGIGGAQ